MRGMWDSKFIQILLQILLIDVFCVVRVPFEVRLVVLLLVFCIIVCTAGDTCRRAGPPPLSEAGRCNTDLLRMVSLRARVRPGNVSGDRTSSRINPVCQSNDSLFNCHLQPTHRLLFQGAC